MASAQSESDEVLDLNELRIVLLGVCGAGKSSTGNAILGREAFTESRTRESEKQRGRVEDRNISIIDTPGFFNTQLTDEEMKKQMMKSLYLCYPGPHVFLLVINLENFKEEKRNIVEKIQENFGEEASTFTMVLFIGREKFSKRECIQIIESEKTLKMLNNFKGRFHVINSKRECDSSQITKLLKIIDEIKTNNGGQNYSNEIYLKNQMQLREEKERMKQEEVRKIHMEMKKRQAERDAWMQKETNPEEEIKAKNKGERIPCDNKQKNKDVKERAQDMRPNAAVKESLRKQMESRREKERHKWVHERQTTQGHPSILDLRIVLLGLLGSGKSSTGNTILSRDAFRASLTSTTRRCEKQEGSVFGRTISIIDTPRLLGSSFLMNMHNVEKSLEMSAPGPHVFLLVIDLLGFTRENTMKWFEENLENNALNRTITLFTHADLLNLPIKEALNEHIEKNNALKSLIDRCGGRFHWFSNDKTQNCIQVKELLEKIDEMVQRNGGGHYTKHNIFKRETSDTGGCEIL